jgi:hypothetical protein
MLDNKEGLTLRVQDNQYGERSIGEFLKLYVKHLMLNINFTSSSLINSLSNFKTPFRLNNSQVFRAHNHQFPILRNI